MKYFSIVFFSVLLGVLTIAYGVMVTRVWDGVERAALALERSETLTKRDALIRSQQVFLEQHRDTRATLDALVVNEGTVVNAIEIVEGVARDTGVTLSIASVTAAPHDVWQYHEKLDIVFSAEGNFSDVVRFVGALETIPVAARLGGVSFEVAEEGRWFGSFTLSFVKTL